MITELAGGTLAAKEACLRAILRSLERVVVAYSGGVDSALVLKIASQELGENAIGITGQSASLAQAERAGATASAAAMGARHEVIATDELDDDNYRKNPANRCYFCKDELYGKLGELAKARNAWIVDGFNLDDIGDYRPGRKAAAEHNVRSPLAEARFAKAEVRALAKELGLDVWDKPALACLSSRVPYGTEISLEILQRIDAAERAVLAQGVSECRVRHHGEIARIEVPVHALEHLIAPGVREAIIAGVKAAGYRYVTIDLGGYVSGNLNFVLKGRSDG